jgi:hypothetical protein
MRDVFEIVPAVLKESAYGLGCTRWEVVRKVVLPYTKTGVVGGVMLGLGRALGETMAVTFVIGNANKLSWSLFAAGNSDRLDAGQRVRRSRHRAAHVLAVRAGVDPVCDYLHRSVRRQDHAGRHVPQGRRQMSQAMQSPAAAPVNAVYRKRLLTHRIGIALSVFAMSIGLAVLAWILVTLLIKASAP